MSPTNSDETEAGQALSPNTTYFSYFSLQRLVGQGSDLSGQNQLEGFLEEVRIKLSSHVSDLPGLGSGRMLQAVGLQASQEVLRDAQQPNPQTVRQRPGKLVGDLRRLGYPVELTLLSAAVTPLPRKCFSGCRVCCRWLYCSDVTKNAAPSLLISKGALPAATSKPSPGANPSPPIVPSPSSAI